MCEAVVEGMGGAWDRSNRNGNFKCARAQCIFHIPKETETRPFSETVLKSQEEDLEVLHFSSFRRWSMCGSRPSSTVWLRSHLVVSIWVVMGGWARWRAFGDKFGLEPLTETANRTCGSWSGSSVLLNYYRSGAIEVLSAAKFQRRNRQRTVVLSIHL